MDIVILSTADWSNPFWTNKQHMAKKFSENGYKVIYVDSIGLRKPTGHKKDLFRIFKRFRGTLFPFKKVSDNIWRISPFILPFHRVRAVSAFNNFYLFFLIRLLSFFIGFKIDIVWTYSPISGGLLSLLKARKNVYHCVDDISSSPGVDKKFIEESEILLLKKVDLVFVTALNLYKKIKFYNKNTYYFNNVADYEFFSRAKLSNFSDLEDIKSIASPKIIFIGAISAYKIDFELISYVLKSRPDWNLILIGSIGEGQPNTSIKEISNLNNLHILGPKKYTDLPFYLRASDVAIIPALINDYTKSMFPMKFFEYLSSGKQVVSTDLPSLIEFKDISYISKTKEDFLFNLSLVLDRKFHKDLAKIDTCARKQTWDERFREMQLIMRNHDF